MILSFPPCSSSERRNLLPSASRALGIPSRYARYCDRRTCIADRTTSQATLHQGGIEDVLLESMSENGLEVARSTIPTSIELTESTGELHNPDSYTAKVPSLELIKLMKSCYRADKRTHRSCSITLTVRRTGLKLCMRNSSSAPMVRAIVPCYINLTLCC